MTEPVFLDDPAAPQAGFIGAQAWRVGDWAMASTTPGWTTVSRRGAALLEPMRSNAVEAPARLEVCARARARALPCGGVNHETALEALTLVMTDRSHPEIAAALERMFGHEPADSPAS